MYLLNLGAWQLVEQASHSVLQGQCICVQLRCEMQHLYKENATVSPLPGNNAKENNVVTRETIRIGFRAYLAADSEAAREAVFARDDLTHLQRPIRRQRNLWIEKDNSGARITGAYLA